MVSDVLGFDWDRSVVPRDIPVHTVERAVWRLARALPDYVWDAAVLEGNPFTYPEVQTLMDGITVGGHKLSDEKQVLNLAAAAKELVRLVKSDDFGLDKETSDLLHVLIAKDEALESGHFRGEGSVTLTPGVNLGEYGSHTPPATEPGGENLRELYAAGLGIIANDVDNVFEQAMVYFLFASLRQFYFDGNKRTARYMMNGHLMSNGLDAISVPALRRLEFNTTMVDFYRTKDGTAMMSFLASCHPDGTTMLATQ